MRKLIASVALAVVALGGGAALADHKPNHAGTRGNGNPGPNGSNNWGLCNAYSRGSANGQGHKHNAPPFQGLEAAADEAGQTVAEWCAENGLQPGGGNE